MPIPRHPIPGVPAWADIEPTAAELAATVTALPAIHAAQQRIDAAHVILDLAHAALALPDTLPSTGRALTALIDAARTYKAEHNPDLLARHNRQAVDLRHDLQRMAAFAAGHELHHGIPLRITRSTDGLPETIQIRSNATDVRRYIEAVKLHTGQWRVEMGDLDTPRGSDQTVTVDNDQIVLRFGLDWVLAPIRRLTTQP